MTIRSVEPSDVSACVAVGEAAWRPVYDEFRRLEGDDLFRRLHPDHHRPKAADVERLVTDDDRHRWVATDGDEVVGFAVAFPESATGLGHLSMVAVAPHHQGRGVGSNLAVHAVEELRRAGMAYALALTHTAPAHDPARRVLHQAGLESIPIQPVQFVLPLDGAQAQAPPPGIRRIEAADVARCRSFGLEAFRPVFASMERAYGPDLFARLRPDWQQAQAEYIEEACSDPGNDTWVLEREGGVAGFVVLVTDDRAIGRIELLAVDPAHQRRGVGGALNRFAVARLAAAGMVYAVVGTGNDAGHAPARASYRAVGFRPWPVQLDMLVGRLPTSG